MPSRLGALFAHHVTHRPNQLAFRDLKRSASYSELWLQAESLERSWPRTDALVWIEVSDPFDAVAAIVTCWRSGRNYGLLTTGERPPFPGLWHQRGSTELLTGASPESINGQLIVFSTSGTTGRPVFVAIWFLLRCSRFRLRSCSGSSFRIRFFCRLSSSRPRYRRELTP